MILHVSKTALIIFQVLICVHVNAQRADLDAYFNRLSSTGKAMGSVCVYQKGEPLYQKAFGYGSIKPAIQADSLTRYRIGSVSKIFTSVVILQMAEEKKLRLSDKLSRFFPDWSLARELTIEQVMRHQSGIHNFANDRSGTYQEADPQTREEVRAILSKSRPDFKPGTRTAYNNANYIVLSLVAEALDSTDFSAIIKKRITDRVQLKRTYLGDSINPERPFPIIIRRGGN